MPCFDILGLKLFPSYSEQYFADEPKNCILYTEFSALSFSRTRNIFENFSCETQTTVMRYELYLEGNVNKYNVIKKR